MNKLLPAALAPLFCLATFVAASAGHYHPTYFGQPAAGPYMPAPRYKNPWTCRILGVRCCKTPKEKYECFLRRYQIVQAKHQARLHRLHWKKYYDYVDPPQNSLAGFVGKGNCNPFYSPQERTGPLGQPGGGHHHQHVAHYRGEMDIQAGEPYAQPADENCATEPRSQPAGGILPILGRKLHGHGKGHQHKPARPPKPTYPVMPPPEALYPAMNREDAVRYLEGFQYYPPWHLLRSPRDFFMFGEKYGLGR